MKKIKLKIKASDLKRKLNIQDGKPGKNGVDGKTPVIPIDQIVATASNSVLEEVLPQIPTIEQIEQDLPKLGYSIRDSLELLKGSDRLTKDSILGLDDYEEISRLARKKGGDNYYGGAGIKQLVAGTGITIDDSNIAYPTITNTLDLSGYLKLDQTTPQTTTGTFTFPRIVGNVASNTTNVISPIAFNLDGSGQLTASSGEQRFAAINPIINQSGTAGYEALCINATEIGTGSGDKELLCLMRNSVEVADINSAGEYTGTLGTFGSVSIPTLFTDTGDPTGFLSRTTSTISWNDTGYTFTITGTNFPVYFKGVKVLKNTQSIAIDNTTTGQKWIYYDVSTQALTAANSFPGFQHVLIAQIYWNSATAKGLLADERHGCRMDFLTHGYLHNTVGTRYYFGLAGRFTNTTFSIDAGEIYDEDIAHAIGTSTTCNVLYKNGSAAYTWTAGSTTPYYTSGGSLYYNNGNTLTAVQANYYVAYWIFATSDPTTPIVSLMGQREDVTIAAARTNNTYEGLSLGTLPFQEMKLLYRVIYRNDATPYEEAADYRVVSNLSTGSYVASLHSALSGLNWSVANHTFDTALNVGAYDITTTANLGVGTASPTCKLNIYSTGSTIGTVSTTAGSKNVTGVGTKFTNHRIYDYIEIAGETSGRFITSITSDTAMVVSTNWGNNNSNVAYTTKDGTGVANRNVLRATDSRVVIGQPESFNNNDYTSTLQITSYIPKIRLDALNVANYVDIVANSSSGVGYIATGYNSWAFYINNTSNTGFKLSCPTGNTVFFQGAHSSSSGAGNPLIISGGQENNTVGNAYAGGDLTIKAGNSTTANLRANVYFKDPTNTNTALQIGNTGLLYIPQDASATIGKLFFGAGNDAYLGYDGTNFVINPKVVGSGYVDVQGGLTASANISAISNSGASFVSNYSTRAAKARFQQVAGGELALDVNIDANDNIDDTGSAPWRMVIGQNYNAPSTYNFFSIQTANAGDGWGASVIKQPLTALPTAVLINAPSFPPSGDWDGTSALQVFGDTKLNAKLYVGTGGDYWEKYSGDSYYYFYPASNTDPAIGVVSTDYGNDGLGCILGYRSGGGAFFQYGSGFTTFRIEQDGGSLGNLDVADTTTDRIFFHSIHGHTSDESSYAPTIEFSTEIESLTIVDGTGFTLYLSSPSLPCHRQIKVIQTGAGAISWGTTVYWAGGTAYTSGTGGGQVDWISLTWDGSNWYGMFGQAFA